MSIIVIGGHSRSVGKTSVVAGLISELAEFQWTAFKITQYGHGICSANGEACDCATGDHSWAISQEKNSAGDSDTSRFLAAGAERVWWVRTEQGRLAEAMPAVRERLKDSPHIIIESNSILKLLRPDLYITVLDPSTADFKTSAREFLDRADAAIIHETRNGDLSWTDVSLKPVAGKPLFRISPPPYVTLEIVEFVRASLSRTQQKPKSV
jgi:molybdopterin-guanine dinucleotide biosynthesis protein